MQGKLLENTKALMAFVPINTTGAAQAGDWVNLKKARTLLILLLQGAWPGGAAAVTLQQASDNAGTGAKTLSFSEYYHNTFSASDTWTRVAVAGDTFNLDTANRLNAIELHATQLDIVNGFTHVRVNTASPGANADLIAGLYILGHLNKAGYPPNLDSFIS